jgi:hypothetical protein
MIVYSCDRFASCMHLSMYLNVLVCRNTKPHGRMHSDAHKYLIVSTYTPIKADTYAILRVHA